MWPLYEVTVQMAKQHFLSRHEATLASLRKSISFKFLPVHPGIYQGESLSCLCSWLPHGLHHSLPPPLLWLRWWCLPKLLRAEVAELLPPQICWDCWCEDLSLRCLSHGLTKSPVLVLSHSRRDFCETVLFKFYLLVYYSALCLSLIHISEPTRH